MVKMITHIHFLAMTSLAFLLALIILGGSFGFVPAHSALLTEFRLFDKFGFRAGSFARIISQAIKLWRSSLVAGGILTIGLILVYFVFLQAHFILSLVAIILLFWLLMAEVHFSYLLSLDGLKLANKFKIFFFVAWLHLVYLIIWLLTLFFVPLYLLPMTLLFAPAIITYIIIHSEKPVLAILDVEI